MLKITKNSQNKKYIGMGIKLIVSFLIVWSIVQAFFYDGLSPYYTIKEYAYQNNFSAEQAKVIQGTEVSQHFIARGNIITSIHLCLLNGESNTLYIDLFDADGRIIKSANMDIPDAAANEWEKTAFDCKVKRGQEYILRVKSDSGLNSIVADTGEKPEIFTLCETNQGSVDGCLAVGINQIYQYITLASLLELIFAILVEIMLAAMLCYAIFNIEDLVRIFKETEKKQGVRFAVYFSVTLMLLFNPIDVSSTKVISFDKVFGQAIKSNVDVSRRIGNFNIWFVFFAGSFSLFFLLINYLRKRELPAEKKKVIDFLDQFMVLANVNLLLRGITYFTDQERMQTVFYYSTSVCNLVVLLCILYLLLNVDKAASSLDFLKIEITAYAVGFPVAILLQKEWQSGKLLFGLQMLIMITALFALKYLAPRFKAGKLQYGITISALAASLIPFFTSFYIELVNVLNQYSIFVKRVARYYAVFIIVAMALIACVLYLMPRKKAKFNNWKTWAYSFLIFGVTCLNVQIPLEKVYNADIFETANSSILISDFLNFGEIPLIQHYGGHMMQGVWEGLIYALINGDYAGAIFSPYAGYLMALLAVLFFLLVRKVWDENMALFVTMLFPFYSMWRYYGLTMLVCLAVWGFLNKNTWVRAAIVWAAFIWCALYRLDLGFSIGIACIGALVIYVIVKRNWTAAKQLWVTLLCWGVFGGILWTVLCLIQGIDPVHRLIEFLMISLSNRNWARTGIGNSGNTLFAWCYLIIPFLIVGCLVYAVFSKKLREETDEKIWIAILIFGFSYFSNFSRGLVRHSLVESATGFVLWDALLFISIFLSAFGKKKELFLPVFTVLLICNTAFTTTANYKELSIADSMAGHVGAFTSTWTLDRFAYEDLPDNADAPATYWESLQRAGKPVNRVDWDENLKLTIYPYRVIMDGLLEDNETFVDFINKTFVYSAINRRNPVYVSQSPLQLSGQYTQEQFVEEMKGTPLVLMPLNNNRAASDLDGIANTYRYYKAAEYIYQNYIPLCRYDSNFAVWCQPDRYDEFEGRYEALANGQDCIDGLRTSNQLRFHNCERRTDEKTNGVVLTFTGGDPIVSELQNIMDLSPFLSSNDSKNAKISVDYNSDIEGQMQVFYTTEENEEYTASKVSTASISTSGTAVFDVPITVFSRLRLDIPEGSTVTIKSLSVHLPVSKIAFGYDEPSKFDDGHGNTWLSYDNGFHSYSIGYLPGIWADYDNARYNEALADCDSVSDRLFVFDRSQVASVEDGNYALIRATYDGNDPATAYEEDDEAVEALAKIGIYADGKFIEKYQCRLVLKEGTHDYLLRVSCDYNWYHSGVNAIWIHSGGKVSVDTVTILRGD